MKTSRLAQWVIDAIGRNPRTPGRGMPARARRAGLRLLRNALVRLLGDPIVRYELDGMPLRLPLSHQLPLIRADHPTYSANLARVAAAMSGKYPNLSMVDIGANVGDSVAIVRRMASFPILCVDGDPGYFPLLVDNVAPLPGVFTEKAFVGDSDATLDARIETEGGTGRLVSSPSSGASLPTRTLSAILSDHPSFPPPRLVKIDTDGFDTRIVCGELDLLGRLKPAIFIEYDPHFFLPLQPDGFRVFHELEKLGYQAALVYDNLGDLLFRADLSDHRLLGDLHDYYTGRGGLHYCDIAIFHQQDADVCARIHDGERLLARQRGTCG